MVMLLLNLAVIPDEVIRGSASDPIEFKKTGS
jgi:hypothetical protein